MEQNYTEIVLGLYMMLYNVRKMVCLKLASFVICIHVSVFCVHVYMYQCFVYMYTCFSICVHVYMYQYFRYIHQYFATIPSCPARYFHISYVQYLAVMSSKFIISFSRSANQINGHGFSTFFLLPMRGSLTQ